MILPRRHLAPRLWFQRVPERRTGKNRVHLDLRADSLESEVARLTDLGATVLARHRDQVLLADPERNEFCVMP
jgi:Glyoxalase-like domain